MSNEAKFYISAARLEANGACEVGIAAFREAYGSKKVPVTRSGLLRAAEKGLNLVWLFERVDEVAELPIWRRLMRQGFTSKEMALDPEYRAALWAAIERKAKRLGL